MREITKTISVPVDGKPMDFRLTKLDAFSGVALLRMLSKMPQSKDGGSVMGFVTNLSETEPLIMVMWANEIDDPEKPDTYADPFVM